MGIEWEDRLLESVGRIGGVVVFVNEGAEGWRLHLRADPFVVAPRGAPLADAKRAAEEAIEAIVRAAVAAERELLTKAMGLIDRLAYVAEDEGDYTGDAAEARDFIAEVEARARAHAAR